MSSILIEVISTPSKCLEIPPSMFEWTPILPQNPSSADTLAAALMV